ncbi:hypothetical protein M3J09_006409 [Ascochyta lentis]
MITWTSCTDVQTLRDILPSLTMLTGTIPVSPFWSCILAQCRFSRASPCN